MGSQTPLMPFFYALAKAEIGLEFSFLNIRHAAGKVGPLKLLCETLAYFEKENKVMFKDQVDNSLFSRGF